MQYPFFASLDSLNLAPDRDGLSQQNSSDGSYVEASETALQIILATCVVPCGNHKSLVFLFIALMDPIFIKVFFNSFFQRSLSSVPSPSWGSFCSQAIRAALLTL